MSKTRGDYSGSEHEDANEDIENVLEIVDLLHIPNITQDQIILRAFPVSLTGATSHWPGNEPAGSILTWEEVILFYNGLDVPTRQILDSKGVIPTKRTANEKVAIQEMAKYSQKWHNETSRTRSTETSDGLAVIQAQLNNLKREIKKVNEKVYAVQIGQMSKVLQERGFGSLPNSMEINPRGHVKSISTAKADSTGIRHIGSALVDLGASVSVMTFSTYTNLGLGDLAHTRLIVELADRIIKHQRGIAENVLVMIGKFIFHIDFIILDILEDDDVPLILRRPFFSTAHAKIDVYKRKFTLRVGEEKNVFKSIKPATSIIRKVHMLRTDLDSKTEFIGEDVNKSFDPHYGDYIELNDFDVPLEPKMNQDENFEPTIDENVIVNKPASKHCYKMKFSCMIGYKHVNADFLPTLSTNVMSKHFYNSIIKDEGDHEGKKPAGTLIDIPIFVGNFSIISGFSIIDGMDVTSGVMLGMPFCKKFMSCQKIMEKFA
ncbi:retrovirus-related pol polyprotein from transposon TNT 1-94 [Tanacetum coccineum]